MAKIDLSEFEALSKPPSRGCRMKEILSLLSPAERRKVNAALMAKKIATTGIVKWLGQRGHLISATTVKRHRRGECNCARSK